MYAKQAPAPGSAARPLLVRLPNHLGDACMALPAIARLGDLGYAPLLVGRAWAPRLFESRDWPVLGLAPGPLGTRLRALRAFARDHGARATLLLTNSFSSALEARLAGLVPAGYARDGRSLLLRPAIAVPHEWAQGTLHTSAWYWRLAGVVAGLSPAEADAGLPAPALEPGATARERARAALAAAGLAPGEPYVVLCPAATGLHRGRVKRWDGFARLADALIARGERVLACPGPGEREDVAAAVPQATIAGPIDVGGFAALLAGSRLVVANDSGASHLAAAAGARILTVIGVTEPARTAARGANAHWIGSEQAWPDYADVESRALSLLAEAPA